MDTCPTCQKSMPELSELTGMSLHDLVYWCQNCGTIVYSGGNEMGIFPSLLGVQAVKRKSYPRLFDQQIYAEDQSDADETASEWIKPEGWLSIRISTDVSSY